jgi:serine/threonine-protein kinase RsbW
MVALLAAEKELHVICDGTVTAVHHAMAQVTDFLRARPMPKAHADDLLLALSEALSNISRHGYQQQVGAISFTITLGQDALTCCVRDTGCAYDPTNQGYSLPEPSALQEGGYGWFIIRSLAEKINYARADGVNRLCFSIPMAWQKRQRVSAAKTLRPCGICALSDIGPRPQSHNQG